MNYSKAAKKKNKKAKKTVHGDLYGQWREGAAPAIVEVDRPLESEKERRSRVTGLKKTSQLMGPAFSGHVGEALAIGCKSDLEEGEKLRKIFNEYCSVIETHAWRKYSLRIHAKVSKLEYIHEEIETRPDDRQDDRTEDEKVSASCDKARDWKDHMEAIGSDRMIIDMVARREMQMDLHKDQELTAAGANFLRSMRRLAKVVDKQAS